MRETLISVYLEYVNDYLTVEKYAEIHGLTNGQASILISLARQVANSDHPEA